MQIWPGAAYPLGATFDGSGTNFSVFSEHADSIEAARRPSHALEAELAEAAGLPAEDLVARLRAAWEAGA